MDYKNIENLKVGFWVFGFIVGVFVTAYFFMENSKYNGTLIEKKVLEYNSTTGEVQWVK